MVEKDKIALTILNKVIQELSEGKNTSVRLSEIPDDVSDSVKQLKNSVELLLKRHQDGFDFIMAISKGKLDMMPPKNNNYISAFKQLHADLMHLTWQTQEIAEGNYDQRVNFMGDFSDAFNKLIDALREKKKLEDEVRKTAEELHELNATKDKLFSIIAHDLRGPILNIKLTLDLLLNNRITQPEKQKDILLLLHNTSTSTYYLLENLLSWARSQKNEISFNPNQQELLPVIKEVISLLNATAAIKEVKLINDVEKSQTAYFDEDLIRTVIRNLISNAIKFTASGGSVIISSERKEGTLEVAISDTGVGISEEDMAKLFKITTHFSKYGTAKEKGQGLGLILCKELIEKHGGNIRIESQPGKGSTLYFTLPSEKWI